MVDGRWATGFDTGGILTPLVHRLSPSTQHPYFKGGTEMQDLKDKVALVTGGGQGLGEAICRSLAEAGAIVAVADIREDQAENVAESLRRQDAKALALRLDVSDEAQAESVIRRTAQDCGRLDFLINNAGMDRTVPVEEMTIEDWDRIMAVNLRGPFVMSKHAMAVMRDQERGHIVNITSTAA